MQNQFTFKNWGMGENVSKIFMPPVPGWFLAFILKQERDDKTVVSLQVP